MKNSDMRAKSTRALVLLGLALAFALLADASARAATASITEAVDGKALEALLAEDRPSSSETASKSFSWQSLNPDLSLILDVAAAYFSSDDPLMSGGHDPNHNGFNFQQLELAIGSSVDPYFRLDANIVFSLFGVEVEEAYATTLGLPWGFQIRAGQFLTRFGRINNTHPHSWSFVDQMFILGRYFGGEGNRGLGLEVSNLLPLPWYVELAASMSDAAGAATARSFYGGNNLGVRGIEDFQYTPTLKQFFALSEHWSLNWGLSGAFAPNATGRNNRSDIYGTDVYLKWRPIRQADTESSIAIQAEYLLRYRQVPDNLNRDHGGYIYSVWQINRRWSTGLRYEYGSATYNTSAVRIADDLDPDWTNERHRFAVNGTFWPSEFSRFRLQVNHDIATWRTTTNWAAFLAAEFVIGAHGAHAF